MKKPNARSPLARVWTGMTSLAMHFRRVSALRQLDGERLSRIENRLAMLDGGAEAETARREALAAVNLDAVADGREPLALRLIAGGKIQWTGELKDAPR
jgi:hypothetical protein